VSRVRIGFEERGEVVEYGLRPTAESERAEYLRGFKAMMLATTLEAYEALLRGESVPVDQLAQEQIARYGLRRR
jgi:hypothetical protein